MESIKLTVTQWQDMHKPGTVGNPLSELREKIENEVATIVVTGFSDVPFERKVIFDEVSNSLIIDSSNS